LLLLLKFKDYLGSTDLKRKQELLFEYKDGGEETSLRFSIKNKK
jgi:hypothetical protein